MGFKLINADNRDLALFPYSPKLKFVPENSIILNTLLENNPNLVIPKDQVTMSVLINMYKMKFIGYSYEYCQYLKDELPFTDKERVIFWIKIWALIKELEKPESKKYTTIAFIDSDAWVRDEHKFKEFVEEFERSSYTLGSPKDVQQGPDSSRLNSGFIIVKNNEKALMILKDIFYNPCYSKFYLHHLAEQCAISLYMNDHPEDIQELSMHDFNTPCGSIVRHCWIKHWTEPMMIDEIYSIFTKFALGSIISPEYSFRKAQTIYSE
jgi:hypothetical protein